jgi:hypothetical protein
MKTINIIPDWILENLSHTIDIDRNGQISVYTGNASDANWIELALNSLEISFEAYDYLDVNKDIVFGFDFQIDDIEYKCPNLSKRVREMEISKGSCRQENRNNDNKKDISEADRNFTFEQALEQASSLDRFCPFKDEPDNTLCSFFYDLGDNINEYYKIINADNEYDYMKMEEPDCIDQGEWEFMLYQDLEYYSSLKSGEVDVYVSDISNLIELLNKPLEETVFRLYIHWNDGENKFLIMVTDYQPFFSYKVGLEKETNNLESVIYLGNCIDSSYVLDIIQYFQNTGKSLGYCDGCTEVEILNGTSIPIDQILSERRIDHILDLSIQRYYADKINLDIEQALTIMLSITHFFKLEMDHKVNWYNKHANRVEKEIEDFKKVEGIKDWWDEMDWIQKNGALEYNICIQDLLFQTLYTLNGSYYRINDRDYEWEEEFDKIFVDMPFGREFDRAIIKFLLLPLYNSTHNTKYILQSDFLNNNGENINE